MFQSRLGYGSHSNVSCAQSGFPEKPQSSVKGCSAPLCPGLTQEGLPAGDNHTLLLLSSSAWHQGSAAGEEWWHSVPQGTWIPSEMPASSGSVPLRAALMGCVSHGSCWRCCCVNPRALHGRGAVDLLRDAAVPQSLTNPSQAGARQGCGTGNIPIHCPLWMI